MDLAKNEFKAGLRDGRVQIGFWCSLCSPMAAEILSDSGAHWLLLDSEHAPNEIGSLFAQLQAVGETAPTPIVRPAWNDPVLIKRILDIGCQTLLVPFVQNGDEAKAAVRATRYPPDGIRGVTASGRASRYGRRDGYLPAASNELCVLVQLETREALQNLDAIAGTSGVDGVFVGPADLAASMGHLGNPQHPKVQEAIAKTAQRLMDLGTPAGILAGNPDQARRYAEMGYRFIAVGSDVGMLVNGSTAVLQSLSDIGHTS